MASHKPKLLSESKHLDFDELDRLWEQWETIFIGGEALAEHLPRISKDEKNENYEARQAMMVDLIEGKNSIQEQEDILFLSEMEFQVADERLTEWSKNVDGKETTLRDFVIKEVIGKSLYFRKIYILIDRPPLPENASQSEANAIQPIVSIISPRDVKNWRFEPGTEILDRLVTMGGRVKREDNWGFVSKIENTWSLWADGEIRTQDVKAKLNIVEDIALGVIPIIYFDLGDSLFEGLWGSVLTTNQHYSMGSVAGQNQVYGHMVFKTNKPRKKVNVGLTGASQVEPEGDVIMVSSPVEGIKANMEIADRTLKHVKRQMREKVISMGLAMVEQSGKSKARDQDAQEAFSKFLYTRAFQAVRLIYSMTARYFGDDDFDTDKVTANEPDQFVQMDRDADRADGVALNSYLPRTKNDFIAAEQKKRRLAGLLSEQNEKQTKQANEDLEKVADEQFSALEIDDTSSNITAVDGNQGSTSDPGDSR